MSNATAVNDALSQLAGQSLAQFTMWGHGLYLDFDGGHVITVETALSVTVGDVVWEGEPATADAAAALLKVVHTDVLSAKAVAGGRLVITTEHAVIEVGPHDHYEAWKFSGPARLLFVCVPGGRIDIVSGDDV